jgi:polyphosphate kinase
MSSFLAVKLSGMVMKSADKQAKVQIPKTPIKQNKKAGSLPDAAVPTSAKRRDKNTTSHLKKTKISGLAVAELTKPLVLLNREESILQFNYRVLEQARRSDVPLLERLRYLCIVSSNMDEFFEVRVPPLVSPVSGVNKLKNPGGITTSQTFEHISAIAHALVEQQYALYNEVLIPALSKVGIEVLQHGERNEAQRSWVSAFFHREVRPLLVPIGLDPAHPFPQVANKSLNFIVRLNGKDAFGRENNIAIVKVPRVLPRVIRLPEKIAQGKQVFVLLSSVIRAHLFELFPGREVSGFSQFRVTRDSDLWVDEQEVGNLRQALRGGLTQRHFGNAVRLEVASACPPELSSFLLNQFKLPEQSLFRVQGPVNLVRLNALIDAVDAQAAKGLLFTPYEPAWPRTINPQVSMFEQLKHGDVMLHLPFESFDPTLLFLKQAVADPQVLAIKQTIYRAGTDSALMELLIEAVQRGKEVTVVVELKARFDEEANINWAERLEHVGAQVVYGVVGLKTHGKMLLITRRESGKSAKQLMRYAHLSTGNYNPRTARLYTDVAMFTAHPDITSDVEQVFQHMASQSKVHALKHLWLAPFTMHKQLIEHIHEVRDAALENKPARIVAKMNALLEDSLIEALVEAARAGAHIDLIVRGACTLPPGLKGHTDRIKVRSVVGRFLEHSRVFYFRAGKQESLYLASADWMGRNIFRRIEIAWPVLDKAIRQRIMDEVLTPYLQDGVDAWQQNSDGSYTRALSEQPSAQQALMLKYGGR